MVSESSLHLNDDLLGIHIADSSFTPMVDKANLVIKTNSLRKSSVSIVNSRIDIQLQ
jgi:hypothetical protein